MQRLVLGAMVALGLMGGAPARAQEIYETPQGVLCLEGWITAALLRINGYQGSVDYNSRKLFRLNRFGFILGTNAYSNYDPDNWVQYGANRNSYMWNFLYTSEAEYPVWPVAEYNAARVPGLRSYVRQCVGNTDTGTSAGIPPGANFPTATISASASCPPNWSLLANYPGVILGCYCPASAISGSVWGTSTYTSDSSLCAAAAHSGMIGGGGGPVWSTIGGGGNSFTGTTRNGITSGDYGAYGSTASFLGAPISVQPPPPSTTSCPGTMQGQPDILACYCDSAAIGNGTVWGTGVYTDDSQLCRAALHAGAIGSGGGTVNVRVLPGQNSYSASTRNGVATIAYGQWGRSFEFAR